MAWGHRAREGSQESPLLDIFVDVLWNPDVNSKWMTLELLTVFRDGFSHWRFSRLCSDIGLFILREITQCDQLPDSL